jgi:PEP-CTERM motif
MQTIKTFFARSSAAALFLGFAMVSSIQASTFSVSVTGAIPVDIDTANGTPASNISLAAASSAGLSLDTTFGQNLHFFSGYDGAAGPIPFSLFENVTITDELSLISETQWIAVTGSENVSPTSDPDTISLDAGQTYNFSTVGVSFTTRALTFFDAPPFPGGTSDMALVADVANAPEPGTWAMLISGLGLVGLGALKRSSLPKNERAKHKS